MATDDPNRLLPFASDAVTLPPDCRQAVPDLRKNHTAPVSLLSPGPPTMAFRPSAESETLVPAPLFPLILPIRRRLPTVTPPPWIEKTQAAPLPSSVPGAPTSTVRPLPEIPTLDPNLAPSDFPDGVTLASSRHRDPVRLKIKAAPGPRSPRVPTTAVLPSPETATLSPPERVADSLNTLVASTRNGAPGAASTAPAAPASEKATPTTANAIGCVGERSAHPSVLTSQYTKSVSSPGTYGRKLARSGSRPSSTRKSVQLS